MSLFLPSPTSPKKILAEQEIRLELPFQHLFDNLSYIGIVFNETWNVPPHFHDHFELCYVDEGDGWFAIDDYFYQVRQGDLFLTKPGEIHKGASAGDLPYRLYYLGFQLHDLRMLEADFFQIGIHRVAKDEEHRIKQFCDAIFEEIKMNCPHANLMVQGLFIQLIVTLLRIYGNLKLNEMTPLMISPELRKILSYLHEDVHSHHKVDQLAKMVNVSRTHLDREFKRTIGLTTGQYIRSLCLDHAKYWLRESSMPITGIAEKLRFESPQLFSIFFKRMMGMSPQEYRKSLLSMKETASDEKV